MTPGALVDLLTIFMAALYPVQEGMMVHSGASGPQCLSPTAISPGPPCLVPSQPRSTVLWWCPHLTLSPVVTLAFSPWLRDSGSSQWAWGAKTNLSPGVLPHTAAFLGQGLRVSRLIRLFLNELRTLICCLSLYYVCSIICFSDNEHKN